jgi:polyhydroxyalkanoate synthase
MPGLLTDPGTVVARVRRDLDRAARRTRNGLKFLAGVDVPPVGCSPHEVVWGRDKVRLLRYCSDRRTVSPPVLLVMSLVTKPYIFDLRPGNSFVEALLDRGLDVYVVDWGVPDAVEAQNTFETYCDEYLPRAADAVMTTSGTDELIVYGYCFGAVLSLLFLAGHRDLRVRALGIMATPVDFSYLGATPFFFRDGRFEVDDLLDETGNVPASVVLDGIRTMKATGDLASYAGLLHNLDNREFITAHRALTGWAQDHIPFPGATCRQTVDWFIRDDQLVKGRVVLGGREVDLRSIMCPTLNVVGEADHIVPPQSTAPILDVLPNVDDAPFPAGHVGLIVGGSAQRRSIPVIADWLVAHGDHVHSAFGARYQS